MHISVGRVKTHGTDLSAHTINADAHIARMPGHDNAVILIQIKLSVFDCKIRNPKRHLKISFSDGYKALTGG